MVEKIGYQDLREGQEFPPAAFQVDPLTVADYLKAKGVANKLVAKGFGISYPIADNATEAGRIKNRRVELVWIGE